VGVHVQVKVNVGVDVTAVVGEVVCVGCAVWEGVNVSGFVGEDVRVCDGTLDGLAVRVAFAVGDVSGVAVFVALLSGVAVGVPVSGVFVSVGVDVLISVGNWSVGGGNPTNCCGGISTGWRRA